MKNALLFFAIIFSFAVSSCRNYQLDRIEKRHYRPGWYVQFSGRPKTFPQHYPTIDPTPQQLGLGIISRPQVQKSVPVNPPQKLVVQIETISDPPQQQSVIKPIDVTTNSTVQKVSVPKKTTPKKHVAAVSGNVSSVSKNPKPVYHVTATNGSASRAKSGTPTVHHATAVQINRPVSNPTVIKVQQQTPPTSDINIDIQMNNDVPSRTNDNNNFPQQAPSSQMQNKTTGNKPRNINPVHPNYEGRVGNLIQSK